MGRGYYRRRGSRAGEMARDVAVIGNRLPWWGAATMGAILFVLFYWVLPAWVLSNIESAQSSAIKPLLEAAIGRRARWLQYLGIAFGLIGLFFAIRNYFTDKRLDREDSGLIAWLSRLMSRLLD